MNEPLLVTGSPASGKTLLCMMLDGHPNVAIPYGELVSLWGFRWPLRRSREVDQVVNDIIRATLPDSPTAEFEARIRKNARSHRTYSSFLRHVMDCYAAMKEKKRWGIHSHYWWHEAGTTLREWPDAKIIHVLRDPRDRYAALLRRDVHKGKRKARFLGDETAESLLEQLIARRNEEQFPRNYLIVRYEQLVGSPEDVLGKVIGFGAEKEIPYQQLIDHGAHVMNRRGAKRYGPLSPHHVGMFRNVLPKKDTQFIERIMNAFFPSPHEVNPDRTSGSRAWASVPPLWRLMPITRMCIYASQFPMKARLWHWRENLRAIYSFN